MSCIILDQESLASLLKFGLKNSPIKSFDVKVNKHGKLYFNIIDVDLDGWFMNVLADHTEFDLEFKIKNNKLNIRIDLYGALMSVIQNMPLLDNIILFFCPSLKKIKGIKIIDLKEIEIDLNVFCDFIKVNDIRFSENQSRAVMLSFLVI